MMCQSGTRQFSIIVYVLIIMNRNSFFHELKTFNCISSAIVSDKTGAPVIKHECVCTLQTYGWILTGQFTRVRELLFKLKCLKLYES